MSNQSILLAIKALSLREVGQQVNYWNTAQICHLLDERTVIDYSIPVKQRLVRFQISRLDWPL